MRSARPRAMVGEGWRRLTTPKYGEKRRERVRDGDADRPSEGVRPGLCKSGTVPKCARDVFFGSLILRIQNLSGQFWSMMLRVVKIYFAIPELV